MIYPQLPGLSEDGQIYLNQSMGTLEALIPPGEWSTAHAPALLELPEGDLLCAWFAGSYEGRGDVSIVCARMPKGTQQWQSPIQVSNDPHRSEQNPSLFLAPNGEVWLVYTSQQERLSGKKNMQFTSIILRQRSTDGGRTWGEPEILFDRRGSFCRQPIQILNSGRWIFSNWLCSESELGLANDPTAFQLSDDQGASWKMVDMPESTGRVHANVIELQPGNLVAFLRSRTADYIYRSTSTDDGLTWSVPEPTILPNNNSGISVIKLNSGRLAIAYNPTQAPRIDPKVASWPTLRSPMTVALSEDGGDSWPMIRIMEHGEGYLGFENRTNNSRYEYPVLMQTKDERLHLAFAYKNRWGIKWMSFTEEDIMGKKREPSGIYDPRIGII